MEIERKYIAGNINYSYYPNYSIEQAYIAKNNGIKIRVRKVIKDNETKYTLTYKKKLKSDININTEYELDIDEDLYNQLKDKRYGNVINKTRYLIPFNGLVAELDIFHDKLEGLKLVEVEFKDHDSYKSFKKPIWFLSEVTDDKRFSNSNLVDIDSYKDILNK
jgi:CYTH domain-containing protein